MHVGVAQTSSYPGKIAQLSCNYILAVHVNVLLYSHQPGSNTLLSTEHCNPHNRLILPSFHKDQALTPAFCMTRTLHGSWNKDTAFYPTPAGSTSLRTIHQALEHSSAAHMPWLSTSARIVDMQLVTCCFASSSETWSRAPSSHAIFSLGAYVSLQVWTFHFYFLLLFVRPSFEKRILETVGKRVGKKE